MVAASSQGRLVRFADGYSWIEMREVRPLSPILVNTFLELLKILPPDAIRLVVHPPAPFSFSGRRHA